MSNRPVEVAPSGYVTILHQGMMQVSVERRLDSCHVFKLGQVSHGDLLLPVVGLGRSHDCNRLWVGQTSRKAASSLCLALELARLQSGTGDRDVI